MTTQKFTLRKNSGILLVWMTVLVFSGSVFAVTEIYLRADTTTLTMTGGRLVEMWGFAQDSAFEAHDGTVSVPGPQITIDPAESHLIIHLENNLPEPVSIVIPGQVAPAAPVSFTDDQGRDRIRSFTHETPSGNTTAVNYEWTDLRPGTFLYQSGSHPAIQIQMGLYGCLKKDFSNGPVKQAYDGIEYDNDVVLVFSEIDPALHDAIQADEFGPAKSVTSTIDYSPKYFLINGKAFTTQYILVNGEIYATIQPTLSIGQVDDRVLLRLVNAGIKSHAPSVENLRGSVVAEDGYAYNYPYNLCSFDLSAGKTKDVVIVPKSAGKYSLYDHALRLTNDSALGGGMMVKLDVTAPPPPAPAPEPQVVVLDAGTVFSGTSGATAVATAADIDNNGTINYRDVLLFIQYVRAESNVADLNGDGVVDQADVKLMMEQLKNASPAKRPSQLRRESRLRARNR